MQFTQIMDSIIFLQVLVKIICDKTLSILYNNCNAIILSIIIILAYVYRKTVYKYIKYVENVYYMNKLLEKINGNLIGLQDANIEFGRELNNINIRLSTINTDNFSYQSNVNKKLKSFSDRITATESLIADTKVLYDTLVEKQEQHDTINLELIETMQAIQTLQNINSSEEKSI